MKTCRFCDIANEAVNRSEDTIFAENNEFFAISSIGALVEGWTLIVPRMHCCSMKDIYGDKEFIEFANKIAKALKACYGPIIAFEHGPNCEGVEVDDEWEKSSGRVHVLEKPISQFFRRIIANDMGISEKYNYKTNPDTKLTLKTVERMTSFFDEYSGGNNVR